MDPARFALGILGALEDGTIESSSPRSATIRPPLGADAHHHPVAAPRHLLELGHEPMLGQVAKRVLQLDTAVTDLRLGDVLCWVEVGPLEIGSMNSCILGRSSRACAS